MPVARASCRSVRCEGLRIGGGRCAELLVALWQYSGQLPRPRADTSPDMFLSGLVLCFCGLGLVRVTWGPPRRLQRPTVSLGCAGTICTFSGLRRYKLYLRFPPRYNLYLFWGAWIHRPCRVVGKGYKLYLGPLRKYNLYFRCAGKVQVVPSLRWKSTSCTCRGVCFGASGFR